MSLLVILYSVALIKTVLGMLRGQQQLVNHAITQYIELNMEEKFHISNQPCIILFIKSTLFTFQKENALSLIHGAKCEQLIGYLKHRWKIIVIFHVWRCGFS